MTATTKASEAAWKAASASLPAAMADSRALPPVDLRVVLAPVDLVWARLERPAARRLVEAAARSELARVVGFAGRTDAPQVLADRLARRLGEQMRLAGPIKDPVGWLIGRGLPQRQLCAEPRCDEGALLDSGRDCPRCEDRQLDRRVQRRAVATAVDAAMPGASENERRAAVAQQLHQDVTAEAWAKARRWEQVREQQAAAKAHRAEAAAAQPADVVVDEPLAPVVLPAPRPAAVVPTPEPEPEFADVDEDQELVLEDLTPDQVRDWRVRGLKDPHERARVGDGPGVLGDPDVPGAAGRRPAARTGALPFGTGGAAEPHRGAVRSGVGAVWPCGRPAGSRSPCFQTLPVLHPEILRPARRASPVATGMEGAGQGERDGSADGHGTKATALAGEGPRPPPASPGANPFFREEIPLFPSVFVATQATANAWRHLTAVARTFQEAARYARTIQQTVTGGDAEKGGRGFEVAPFGASQLIQFEGEHGRHMRCRQSASV
ncbi:hypothetical protein [Streptomyces lavendulocolor]|uniref:hypothetical protein n=1 Tax=Streptomyces lavendulocolor TaxID=67316 RepID=UPI003C2CC062